MGYIKNLRKLVGSRPLIMAGANVLLFDEMNRLLLQLRKDNHCWGLTGGGLEPGETLEQVAIRELYEETGLRVRKLKLFDIFSGHDFYYQYPHGDEVYNVIASYICTDYEGTLKAEASEVLDLQFYDLNDLPTQISPPDLPIIRAFISQYRII
ncbi:ADP-ribose pyrophosphatase YjhB (NUDIX family) [Bacillus oleivorans]|uniref:ADP-ribose pyrophosphatase YjhB (NUDIX family) n=1 Tax=Bacillus oleivorans TaxID=1448271 RepID=A0A285D6W2_9BACI|nr:NUDIX hydrolase [Bacillus oleivorans]SNX74893.1 ADP-ribose pyrophosphatase YjhB (NUDIX family) [Bacillus oleivorans]